MEIHTAIDKFDELRTFIEEKKQELDGKAIRIKVMADSNIVANEEGFFINPDKITNSQFSINDSEINLYLFRNPNPNEVPVNAKVSFNLTKELWQEMRPKFIISYS